MPELIIGAVLGVLSIISVAGLMLSIYLFGQIRDLHEELDDFDDAVRAGAESFGEQVQTSLSALEGATRSLAAESGLAWDGSSGEWRRVQ